MNFKKRVVVVIVLVKKNKWLEKVCAHMPKFAEQDRHEERVVHPMVKKWIKSLPNIKNVMYEETLKTGDRPDFILQNKQNRYFVIEVKSDKSKTSSSKELQLQINRYKTATKKEFGNLYMGVIAVSDKGQLGYTLTEATKVLKQKGFTDATR